LNRLVTLSSGELTELFATFPSTPVAWRIRVSLCYKYLFDRSSPSNDLNSIRPRPQARATRTARQVTESEPFAVTVQDKTGLNSIASCHSLPSMAGLLKLMELTSSAKPPSSAEPTHTQICFELVIAYGWYHQTSDLSQEQRTEWSAFVNSPNLANTLDTCFGQAPEDEARRYRDILNTYINHWQQTQ
jgi:hypothetical protein